MSFFTFTLRHRGYVVVAAVVIQLCLGSLFAWNVFTLPLTRPVAQGGYGFSTAQTQWVFSAALMTFALTMVFAGRMQETIGPRRVSCFGGFLLGLGYILAGLYGKTFLIQLLCIGIIGGMGLGCTYVIPISLGVKWFPDKKGLITGMSVAGFGFGSMIWVKFASTWFGGLLYTLDGFWGLSGVQAVFLCYGCIYLVGITLGSLFMINPPEGYCPPGWHAESPQKNGRADGRIGMTEWEMLGTRQYYMISLIFMGSTMAGLMMLGGIHLFGKDALLASGAARDWKQAEAIAGTAVACLAILNGLGRIIWGWISDAIGRKTALFLLCTMQGITMMLFFHAGAQAWSLIACATLLGFNFGGNFALFPAATADFFGNQNLARNYGYIFIPYGMAGILGPQLAAHFVDAAKAVSTSDNPNPAPWHTPFIIAGIACFAAALVASQLQPPRRTQNLPHAAKAEGALGS